MQGRFRRVVRVDPIEDGKQWMALCDDPCETNQDCLTGTHCVGMRLQMPSSSMAISGAIADSPLVRLALD
jgi:hypothetical protein